MPSIQAALETEYGNVLLQENSAQRVRAAGALLALALRTLEVGEFEERIVALETRLAAAHPKLGRTA